MNSRGRDHSLIKVLLLLAMGLLLMGMVSPAIALDHLYDTPLTMSAVVCDDFYDVTQPSVSTLPIMTPTAAPLWIPVDDFYTAVHLTASIFQPPRTH